jgi:hypothetical protein
MTAALKQDPDVQTALTVLSELLAGKTRTEVIRKADCVGRLTEELRTGLTDTGLIEPPVVEEEE